MNPDPEEIAEKLVKQMEEVGLKEYQEKICSLWGDTCPGGDCTTYEAARDYFEEQLKREWRELNDPAELLNFRADPYVRNGYACKGTHTGLVGEAVDLGTLFGHLGGIYPPESYGEASYKPAIDGLYPTWPKIRETVEQETAVQKILISENPEAPLIIICDGRVLAIASTGKRRPETMSHSKPTLENSHHLMHSEDIETVMRLSIRKTPFLCKLPLSPFHDWSESHNGIRFCKKCGKLECYSPVYGKL